MKKIGILGGGQLGLMTLQAAMDLNFEIAILGANHDPCHRAAKHFYTGDLLNYHDVVRFGSECEILTIEIEKVNTEALAELERRGVLVRPSAYAIALIQNKIAQKQFLRNKGFPTADFVITQNRDELGRHVDFLPAVHKLAQGGYDGRGVQMLETIADFALGFDSPAVLEKKVPILKELAVIVARDVHGKVSAFPVVEQVFHPQAHLLDYLLAPAQIPTGLTAQAQQIAEALVVELGIVGLLAVELFWDGSQLLVNELAPRPHNSGHHTIEACHTSQFQQFLRAIAGLPLGDTAMRVPFAATINVLGKTEGPAYYPFLRDLLEIKGAHLHLYAKTTSKPMRKMGHITVVAQSLPELEDKIQQVKALIAQS